MTGRSHGTILRVLMLLLVMTSLSAGQRPQRGSNSLQIQYLVFERPGSSADTSIIDFLYRIPGNQFVFLRDQSSGTFIARGELYVEFRNEDGTRIIRDFAAIEIQRQDQVRDQDDIEDYQGLIRLQAPRGEYRAIVEVKDRETDRSFLDRSRRFTFGLEPGAAGVLSNPLLAYSDAESDSYIPFNRGQTIRFGSRGGILVSIRHDIGRTSTPLTWRLTHKEVENDLKLSPIDSVVDVASGIASRSSAASGRLAYSLSDSSTPGWTIAYVHLPLERLEPGLYEISLSVPDGDKTRTHTVELPVIWENRPMSLSRFDLSVDALRYIATEDDIDDMVGFMADGGKERFREFWVRKDPDPTTAYNEVMAEYYRRVDDTILRFSSQGELDGYRSDRGRIYILFGAPTSMNRVFRPESGPREIWEYRDQGKRFIFTDPSRTGEYTLSQTEDL